MTFEQAKQIFYQPFMDLLYKAHTIHRAHFLQIPFKLAHYLA